MACLAAILEHQDVVILDGALGTELERRGVDLSGRALWSSHLLLHDPHTLAQVHLDYLRAGADVVTTATYQASVDALKAEGLDDGGVRRVFRSAVQLAAGARDRFWGEHCAAAAEAAAAAAAQVQAEAPAAASAATSAAAPAAALAAAGGVDGADAGRSPGAAAPTAGAGPCTTAAPPQATGPAAASGSGRSGVTGTSGAASSGTLPSWVAGRARPLVAASCGSYGATLCDGSEFTGAYADSMSEEELMDFHGQRLDALLSDPSSTITATASGGSTHGASTSDGSNGISIGHTHTSSTDGSGAGSASASASACSSPTGIDLLCFETLPCLAEARAVVRLLNEGAGRGIPAWISFSCRDGEHTNHGERFAEEVVPLMYTCSSVVAFGVNCTQPRHIPQLLASARGKLEEIESAGRRRSGACAEAPGASSSDIDGGHEVQGPGQPRLSKVLLAYPNSGEEWDGEHRCWVEHAHSHGEAADTPPLQPAAAAQADAEAAAALPPSAPGAYAALARQWVAAGASLVGGCCRTTPEHIRALRQQLLGSQ